MRFRITVRADNVELRGYFDGTQEELQEFSMNMAPVGMVIASLALDGYDPFGITQPSDPPSIVSSSEVIQGIWESSDDTSTVMSMLTALHYQQAFVIRGERHRAEVAEAYGVDIIERAIALIDETTLGASGLAAATRESAKVALRQVAVDMIAQGGGPRG